MKKFLFTLLSTTFLFGCTPEPEQIVVLHEGSFSFCGSSGAVPTGKKITVQRTEFDEGCAICPVMNGLSISNLAMEGESGTWGEFNVKGNQQTPDGTDPIIESNTELQGTRHSSMTARNVGGTTDRNSLSTRQANGAAMLVEVDAAAVDIGLDHFLKTI